MNEKEEIDKITGAIIGATIKVHKALGPGLLESAYEVCTAYELREDGWVVEQQKPMPVVYRGVELDCGYRLDLRVNQKVIVEMKAVEKILPIHQAQLLSYLKISGCKMGLLINFNVKTLVNGVTRVINGYF